MSQPRLLLLASVLLTTSLNSFARIDYIKAWAETQLKFEKTIYGEINDVSCLKSESFFIGCMHAVNTALSLGNESEIVLVTPDSNETKPLPGFRAEKLSVKSEGIRDAVKAYYKRMSDFYKMYVSLKKIAKPLGFNNLFKIIEQQIVKSEREALNTSIIYNSFLEYAYDPHTSIDPESYFISVRQSTEIVKRYGLVYTVSKERIDRGLLVLEVLENSSAKEAGIEPGDVITAINGISDQEQMLKELNKEEVDLDIEGSKGRRNLHIARTEFGVDTVTSQIIPTSNVGYIKLNHFMDLSSCEKIANVGSSMIEKKVKGLVFDLRSNGGGDVRVAKCLMGLFLEKGSKIWMTLDLESKRVHTEKQIFDERIFKDIHTVVLIDGGSASASEAFSIYLQAYRKAFILGERSFGKGTMQGLRPLDSNPKVIMRKTLAKYLGPHGISPQIQGVKPDFEILPRFNQVEATKVSREEDLYENVIENSHKEVPEMEDRKSEIHQIKDCMKEDTSLSLFFDNLDSYKQRVFDNQLESAQVVIDCANRLKIPVFSGLDIPRYGQKEAADLLRKMGIEL